MLVFSPTRPLATSPPLSHVTDNAQGCTHLLAEMQYEHDDGQYRSGYDDRQCHPRDPLSGPQKQLAFPRSVVQSRGWMNDDARIRNNAFHVDKVLLGMLRRPHEQVLDIIVRPAQAKERVRGEERMVSGLG